MQSFKEYKSLEGTIRNLYKDKEEDLDAMDEAMAVYVKPHSNGTHYMVHKVGKKMAAHGGIKVGEKLSDTEIDDAREVGIKVHHSK